jgi:ankyrin repeat protein
MAIGLFILRETKVPLTTGKLVQMSLNMSQYPYNADIGQTDLMGAAYNGDAEEVVHILCMPCDVDAQDDHGVTALMYASREGHTEPVRRLIEHQADLELQPFSRRYTALMYAVRGGHTFTVQALLTAKADPDVRDEDDTFDTPLTLAASCGFLPIVRALVAAGADVSLRGSIWQLPPPPRRLPGARDITKFQSSCFTMKRNHRIDS